MRITAAAARILPFAAYIGFIVLESLLPHEAVATGPLGGRWLYALQVLAAGALLVGLWSRYTELRERPSGAAAWLLALVAGALVFVLWINLDAPWASFGEGRGLAASTEAGRDGALAVGLRILGAVVVVPIMEELFWRSFLMRWIDKPDFLSLAPRDVGWKGLLGSSLLFGAEHHLWLAGILAGLAFGWLYRRTGNLWTVIVAHAATNLLLEGWVIRTGASHFL